MADAPSKLISFQESKREFAYLKPYAYKEPGSVPGTLNIDADSAIPDIFLIEYNSEMAKGTTILSPEECTDHLLSSSVCWFNVNGLGSEDILQRLGKVFELHPLTLEDIVNIPQRPKIEDYDEQQILLIAHMVHCRSEKDGFISEQVSFILGKNYLLTVQEEPEFDTFEPVRGRIRQGKGRIRQFNADYLTFVLLDTIIEGYFPVMEDYGERMEELQGKILIHPRKEHLFEIHRIKRELLHLRRSLWPQREALAILVRETHPLISKPTKAHLQSCYDSTVQLLDMLETYRELSSGLMDIYLSSLGNRTNEVMRVLTVISTIFIPLTFIAGVYGMNFEQMPELRWQLGYPIALFLMGGIAGSLVLYFWRKGWLSNTND